MDISYNRLKCYLPEAGELTPDELSRILTAIGLEVSAVKAIEPIRGGLKGLVVGEVLTCEAHPNSDHLHITTVNVGEGDPLPIVCGAPNVAAGQKVIVATIGTTLYHGDEAYTIKKGKLRGEVSMGMICSETEIGVGTDESGIMVLPAEAKPGTPAAEWFHLEEDWLISIDITPNRIDATSYFGVARDVAAYLSLKKGKTIRAQMPALPPIPVATREGGIEVTLDLPKEECLRYTGITLCELTNGESPKWLRESLEAIGHKSINAIVDISNFVLFELGQPIHIFDADKIEGNSLTLCHIPEGTPFTTLDGVERKAGGKEIMICDAAKRVLCMAGVLGGTDAEVTDKTTRVFVECANFNATAIRKAARRHGISTDASFRFERGLAPEACDNALRRTVDLLRSCCGAQVEGKPIDLGIASLPERHCVLRLKRMNDFIGTEIPEAAVRTILAALDIQIERQDGDALALCLPSYRTDVTRECDVIEEILRIYGYNEVKPSGYIKANLSVRGDEDKRAAAERRLSDYLTGAGYREILSNSLTAEKYYTAKEYPSDALVHIVNPLSSELGVLRQTLLYGGLEAIELNRKNKQPLCAFYEWGNVYALNAAPSKDEAPLTERFKQHAMLGLWLCGDMYADNWQRTAMDASFYMLKGTIQQLFAHYNIPEGVVEEVFCDETELYADALMFKSRRGGKLLATLGIVHPKVTAAFDIDCPVFYAELDAEQLFDEAKQYPLEAKEINRMPVVTRDLALLLDEEVRFKDIVDTARKAGGKSLRNVVLFDVYTGKNLPEGKKSYAVRFRIQDDKITLTDKQIEKIMSSIEKALTERLAASLR